MHHSSPSESIPPSIYQISKRGCERPPLRHKVPVVDCDHEVLATGDSPGGSLFPQGGGLEVIFSPKPWHSVNFFIYGRYSCFTGFFCVRKSTFLSVFFRGLQILNNELRWGFKSSSIQTKNGHLIEGIAQMILGLICSFCGAIAKAWKTHCPKGHVSGGCKTVFE